MDIFGFVGLAVCLLVMVMVVIRKKGMGDSVRWWMKKGGIKK
jgi:hypothetical protein